LEEYAMVPPHRLLERQEPKREGYAVVACRKEISIVSIWHTLQ